MAKKMFDILPPDLAKKIEKGIESLGKEDKKTNRNKKHRGKNQKERRFPLREVLVGSGVLLLIVAGILYFKLQKAEVLIWPKTEILSFKEQISADDSIESVDIAGNIIPVKYFEEEKELWQEFSATGNASNEGRAEGTIVVYNNYSPASPITLKSGTHFLSDSGKYFVALSKIVIPAAKKQGSKTVPGSVEVKVQAIEGGESYNIKASKFSVPKLAGTSYYYSVYAESSEPMTGGFSTEIKKVTESDIQNAKDVVTKKLLDDTYNSLLSKIPEEYIVLEGAVTAEITEAESAVKADSVIDKFNYQAKAKARALAFKKSDIEELLKEYIASNIPDSRELLENSLDIQYTPQTVDINEGKMVLELEFSVKTYQSIDKNDFISLFRDKSSDQIKELINSRLGSEVSSIEVNFWPFWTTKAPKDKNKINLDLKFE